MVEVGYGHHDMLHAGEDDPAGLEFADDKPIEDEQVNEVENEKHPEGIGEAFPEGVAFQSCGSPEQCRSKGSPDEQAKQDRDPALPLRSGRDKLSDRLRIVP